MSNGCASAFLSTCQACSFAKLRHVCSSSKSCNILHLTSDHCTVMAIGLLALTLQSPSPDQAVLQVHQTLIAFLRRGQIAIELFPPLSLYLGTYSHASIMAWLGYAAHIGIIAIVCWIVLSPVTSSLMRFTVLILSFLGVMGIRTTSDPVTLSSQLSDLFLVAAAATAFLPYAFPPSFYSVPAEVWVLVAMMFSWKNNDPVVLLIISSISVPGLDSCL